MSLTTEEYVSIDNLNQGAVAELGNAELQKVWENINDPNTLPKAIREVTIKIKIAPNENRDNATVSIQATSKLAPTNPTLTLVAVGTEKGKGIAREFVPRQQNIFKQDKGVMPLREVK